MSPAMGRDDMCDMLPRGEASWNLSAQGCGWGQSKAPAAQCVPERQTPRKTVSSLKRLIRTNSSGIVSHSYRGVGGPPKIQIPRPSQRPRVGADLSKQSSQACSVVFCTKPEDILKEFVY